MGLEQRILGAAGALFLGASLGLAQSDPCARASQQLLVKTKDVRLSMFGEVHPERDQNGVITLKHDEDDGYFISLVGNLKQQGYTAVGVELSYFAKEYLDAYVAGTLFLDDWLLRFAKPATVQEYWMLDAAETLKTLKPVVDIAASYGFAVVPVAGRTGWDGRLDYDAFSRRREREIAEIIGEYLTLNPGKMAVFIGAEHVNRQPSRQRLVKSPFQRMPSVIHGQAEPLFTPAAAELAKSYPLLSVDLSAGILQHDVRYVKVDFTVPQECLR